MTEEEAFDETQSKPKIITSKRPPTKQEHRDEILDEALRETFPASDPIELSPCDDDK